MQVHTLGPNMIELEDSTGTRVFVSYKTPVALLHPDGLLEVTLKKWSNTTSRHISKWKKKIVFAVEHHKPQGYFDAYMESL